MSIKTITAATTAMLLSLATPAAAQLETVAAFDPAAGQTPENLAVASDGTIFVSLSFAGEIRRISPDGTQTRVPLPTSGGITTGVAIDRHHGGDVDVAVRSSDPAGAGIWRMSRAGSGEPIRIAPLPTDSFPNGITFDERGALYIADSALGRIWRLAPGASQVTMWKADLRLEPTGEAYRDFPLPGANGIKIRGRDVYVSNTSTRQILSIRIRRDGSAGRVRVRHTGVEADDFAFASNGDLYVAENPPSMLVRISPRGAVTTIATKADGLDNPSAVAFAGEVLYVTNAAYFGTRPTLQRMPTDAIGLVLP